MVVQRGQTTIEHTLLTTALILAMCLLVRHPTAVERLAVSVAHAIGGRPAQHRRHGPGHGGHGHRHHPGPRPCLCPAAGRVTPSA